MSQTNHLPDPPFFDEAQAADWNYDPNLDEVTQAALDARETHKVSLAATDRIKIALLGIDLQRDFCFPPVFDKSGKQVSGGTLYVGGRSGRGAIDDNVRTSRFLYRNAPMITTFDNTMDTHLPYQIFTSAFWQTKNGGPIQPHTLVMLIKGVLCNVALDGQTVIHENIAPRPEVAWMYANSNYTWVLAYAQHYCAELAKAGKYTLYIWPYHCQLGSRGHSLAGVTQAARHYHAVLRGNVGHLEIKGGNPFTENYSVFAPEVLAAHDAKVIAQRNVTMLKKMIQHDIVIVAGQAASHCVLSSLDDAIEQVLKMDPALAGRLHILEDAMSAVTVPDGKGGFIADFTPQAEAALARWKARGCNVVRTTDDIESWPAFRKLAA